MLTWSYGLSAFLEHSNEDQVYARFVGTLIARYLECARTSTGTIPRIADIGCGSGAKSLAIAQHLRKLGVTADWELIDQDESWGREIQQNVWRWALNSNRCVEARCPLSAESWLQNLTRTTEIVQFLHVPYDDDSEEMVFDVGLKLAATNCILIISSEHPRSDLSVIRRQLTMLGYAGLPSERTSSLAERFIEAGMRVKKFVLGRQFLDIGPEEGTAERDWFWDFIFGARCTVENREALALGISDSCRARFVESINTRVLDIPDMLITVRAYQ